MVEVYKVILMDGVFFSSTGFALTAPLRSNWAVSVFMAGVGYTREMTGFISESFSSRYSSNYLTDMAERKEWTNRGWDDAHAGVWKQR